MVGTVIDGSGTVFPASGGDRQSTGKAYTLQWWNSYQSRWDGIIPQLDAGTGDHHLVKDITAGTVTYLDETEDAGTGRPTIWWDDAGKLLHVVSDNNTQCEYWRFSYVSGTDTYTMDVGAAGLGQVVTGISADNNADTLGVVVTPNGKLWVCSQTAAGGLIYNMRTVGTGGAWNGTAPALDATLARGACCASYFTDAGTTNVWFFSAENDPAADAEWNAYFLDEDHGTPFTPGNWTEDTTGWTKTDMDGEESDNHLACVRSGEDILVAVKTGTTTVGETAIGLWERVAAGTYTAHTGLVDWNATVTNRRSRPTIGIDSNGLVYVGTNYEQPAATGDLLGVYITSDATDLDTWSGEVTAFSSSGDSFSDLRFSQSDFIATPTSGVMAVAERIIGGSTQPGDELWYNQIAIEGGPSGAVYRPRQLTYRKSGRFVRG